MDEQSRAFREATESDHIPDEQLELFISAKHLPGNGHINTPEEYELAQWDNGKEE